MAEKNKDVSRAKDGKVKVVYAQDDDIDVIELAGTPPVAIPSGTTITWLAYFDVKKKSKKSANDKVKFKIRLTGDDKFVFWAGPGSPLQRNLSWKESPELTGDPAVGREG